MPDNYTLATNPTQLTNALNRAFTQIIQKVASSTAAAVETTSGEGTGVVYQAFYEPSRQETVAPYRTVAWIGTLQAMFSSGGQIFENNGTVANACCNGNTAVTITYDTATNQTVFYPVNAQNVATGPSQPLYALKPIWNARQVLASAPTTATPAQRAYATSDTTKRYMFTWIDGNNDGNVQSNEVVNFCYTGTTGCTTGIGTGSVNGSASAGQEYLNLVSSTATAATSEATNIINWVRGDHGPFTNSSGTTVTLRNRTMTYSPDDTPNETQRLGDIVDSTPTASGPPNYSYDLVYGDASYAAYRSYYCDRRQVVLVGANDGILHAFNGGFYDLTNQSFSTTPDANTTSCHNGSGGPGSTRTAYVLGEEMWAYVPKDLLGQATWLTSPTYKHIYFVDGTPSIFDVYIDGTNTYNNSGCSVNSVSCANWQTIAVVPFRYGGGELTVNDGTKSPVTALGTFHSGYIVMNITNPEMPPTLMGEITLPANQYATSNPAIVPIRNITGTSNANAWFLAVGSGPSVLGTISSITSANVYVYALDSIGSLGQDANGETISTATFPITGATGTNSFAGDLAAVDWNLDFQTDGIYFGTQQTATAPNFGGNLFKLQTHTTGTCVPATGVNCPSASPPPTGA